MRAFTCADKAFLIFLAGLRMLQLKQPCEASNSIVKIKYGEGGGKKLEKSSVINLELEENKVWRR